ncbi:MAG TPA: diguanylate cyclase response regulator [Deltaproteobacteria bacterium]|jgi:diguanylate cyclase (GGDEF)-like protein|nr:diguanylate cyclase response regulator [Deltaproteobacteria bacterium]
MTTILVIDDSDLQRAETRRALEPTGLFDRILEAADGLAGLRLLLAEAVDVVLCDLEMPGLDGEKLLRVRDARSGAGEIPFLFLTASADTERKVRLLEDGACDTVTKPCHPAELIARLRLHLKIKRLQSELREKNQMLAKESMTDAVTGLRSRRYVTEVLAIEVLRARRYRLPLTVMMADLDHFKRVNDRFGHPVGDTVLRRVSDLLRGLLRATDVAGRFGGEEFLVILPQTDREGAVTLAERWRQSLELTALEAPGTKRIRTTVSIGVAEFMAQMARADELVRAADEALYTAKANGRNRVEVASGV